uniref:ATPase inhibitor, mitochondrial n=1 Tax=Arion vulgaris TaxID=1028688 RepID=A0A0B6YBM4_9EUPU
MNRIVASKLLNVTAMRNCSGKGGHGGSINQAGGIFGEVEQARENQYFRKKQEEQLLALKKHMEDEIAHHKSQAEAHAKAIQRNQEKLDQLKK